MQQEGNFGYTRYRKTEVLDSPYVGDEISMLVLLPESHDGLADLEGWLSADTLTECVEGLQETHLANGLPRFRITGEFDLGSTLLSLGMSDAFSASADYSGITGGCASPAILKPLLGGPNGLGYHPRRLFRIAGPTHKK